ncbi:Immediate early response 3-interacting protein 1 [Tyrophagus putrescentiae]|nr:Immediate early response 3-interacting protein 1 [Tyrophagus putrescentiae]
MTFSLFTLLEAGLLVVNAIAILNEERFLNKIGWGRDSMMINAQMSSPYAGTYGQPSPGGGMTPKMQLMNMIHSIRTVARVPLILINIIVIGIKLIFG